MAVTDYSHKAFEQPEEGPQDSAPAVSLRDRLVPPMPGSAMWGWLGPILVALFGGFLRFYRLGTPHSVVFDETYYAKDAFATIRYGVERQFVDGADKLLLAGNDNIFKQCGSVSECASYVVHPPVGKWLIGLGELIFGANPFGWRFVAALLGTLSILILARTARRMTRSTLLGCVAGLLLCLDALHFVLSRTALLDIFLMFWVLAGFACLVVDRDWSRRRLAEWHEAGSPADGPRLGLRPWRLAAGVLLGLAVATKWTGGFYIAAFAIMTLLWDAGARRAVGTPRPYGTVIRRDLPLAAAWMAVVPIVTYAVSFTGWFVTDKGYGRNWDQATSSGPVYFVIDSLRSWIDYQKQVLTFHTGLESSHPYQSEPWQWPMLLRPVAFFYESPKNCGADSCSWAVLGTGTPVIWFAGLLALIGMIAWYVATRDWRAGGVLLGYAAGWLPWFYFAIADNRTMFMFYAMPMVPFMILALVLACGLIMGKESPARPNRRVTGTAVVGAFVLLALVNFWWLYPVIAAEPIPYDSWHARMLFDSWI
ncbi:dolichyl-phosphate-mannose--protein mannosyltransferase [Microbispora bryophytorum]|uniref:Polyprenol-phosphate-mannose--protein mannosyltransferase n=1 Tax=Microbispora bryophytorum subsp. camponoti TaxID=1677852 RepID=A0ABR8LDJ5_9ACTN|nr:phospholipid carrier-dependent glycosyltransferase [Microbispora camponoti]